MTLQITSEGADEGDWSLEDALDDAGRVLTVAAGVALITRGAAADRADRRRDQLLTSAARNRARDRALDEVGLYSS